MTSSEILSLFKKLKQTSNNQYICCCPAHDDKNPSLSIKDDGEKLILHCHAGCEINDIVSALGINKSDLYYNKDKNCNKSKFISKIKYEYHNIEGFLVYTKARYDYADGKKSFGLYDSNGKKGIKNIERVPYNLHNFHKSKTIYFVEGEKCADILIKNNIVATTLDTGAKSPWHIYYNQYFADKEIIIIPDNDKPGMQYASRIKENLPNAKILILPNLKEKEDIYDWLTSGHTIDELLNLPFAEISEMTDETKTNNTDYETQATKLLRLVDENNTILFHDTSKDSYASIEVLGHREIWALDSNNFYMWLNKIYYDAENHPIKRDNLQQCLNILNAKASFDSSESITLSTRVAKKDNDFWYDLTNSNWEAVKINAEGWSVENKVPILFTRYRHQNQQISPSESDGDVYKILNYINLSHNHILFICWLVTCFVPEIAHAMPVFYGEKGSAKSTVCTLLKQVVDPSALETLSLPKNEPSLAINLQQHWFLPFDNISQISIEISDVLCRAITGGGIQQRKLFTNAEDYIFNFKRCIALNGINNVATRPDLLDRSILIELSRIPEDERKELSEIQSEFKKDLPIILGGIFDVLSKAIKVYASVKLTKLPRMADFARWGYAVGEALGGHGNTFLEEYQENVNMHNIEAINSDIVATIMVAFMEHKNTWCGLVSELFIELSKLSSDLGISSKLFPPQPNVLSRKLNGLRSNLASVGITFSTFAQAKGTTIVINNDFKSSLQDYKVTK